MTDQVFVHVVTYNSEAYIARCLEAVLSQVNCVLGATLLVSVTDNASTDSTCSIIESEFRAEPVTLVKNEFNLGFSGGHNQGVAGFLETEAAYYLCLNPDLRLEKDAISTFVNAFKEKPSYGSACGRLYRADENLNPVEPKAFDAAGMYITPAIRHFDRGSEELDIGQYREPRAVFGGTGACLFMRRDFIIDAILDCGKRYSDVGRVYPALLKENRPQLFDEAFFAYREDADLAWRAQLLGWNCLYVPEAVGYHRRLVLPERRSELSPLLNKLSVRNRFLLQLNNLNASVLLKVFLSGFIFRNILVLFGVLLKERKSLGAFTDLVKLFRRALSRRKSLFIHTSTRSDKTARWFSSQPYTESILEE